MNISVFSNISITISSCGATVGGRSQDSHYGPWSTEQYKVGTSTQYNNNIQRDEMICFGTGFTWLSSVEYLLFTERIIHQKATLKNVLCPSAQTRIIPTIQFTYGTCPKCEEVQQFRQMIN